MIHFDILVAIKFDRWDTRRGYQETSWLLRLDIEISFHRASSFYNLEIFPNLYKFIRNLFKASNFQSISIHRKYWNRKFFFLESRRNNVFLLRPNPKKIKALRRFKNQSFIYPIFALPRRIIVLFHRRRLDSVDVDTATGGNELRHGFTDLVRGLSFLFSFTLTRGKAHPSIPSQTLPPTSSSSPSSFIRLSGPTPSPHFPLHIFPCFPQVHKTRSFQNLPDILEEHKL